LSEDNKLYGWGNNKYHTILSSPVMNVHTPTLCTTFTDHSSIAQIATGDYHVLVLTKAGKIYSWGSNQFGQLGLSHEREVHSPEEVVLGERVRFISAGSTFSVAVTENGEVYTWGQNHSGQLGHMLDPIDSSTPGKLPIPNRIQKIATGEHVVALTEEGGLFVWEQQGQPLGLGNHEDQFLPKKLNLEVEVMEIACGVRHTLMLTREGKLYAWGDNFRGQLGTGDNHDKYYPSLVALVNNVVFVALACGWKHFLALAEDGAVYSWGNNNYNQLGIRPGEPIVTIPQKVPPPSSSPVCGLLCGTNSSFLLTLDGSLYACGDNTNGRLGISGNDDQEVKDFKCLKGKWRLPESRMGRWWREIFFWMFLGRYDQDSAFSIFPIEVLFHVATVISEILIPRNQFLWK
jgi:alpha-tubulin suppressor-like RCC1 family protein